MGHRAGWHATFSAPKSVSLTALVGGDERVREAHREAVRIAVDKMEAYVQARMGGNRAPEHTQNWAAAKFEHDTARPVDGYPAPQLHTHVVFFNMTETRDGEHRAIQPKELYRSQQYGTAVYRAELAWRVRELGYQLESGKNGAPEIKGYSREYLEANSPRRQQIQEHLKEAGLSGAGPAQIAAHRTREEKLPLDRTDVKALHRTVAEAYGSQPSQVVREARERGPAQTHEPFRHAHAAVTYARDKSFEREAVVDQRDLLKEALKHASGKAPAEHVSRAFDERIKRGDFVAVARDRPGSASRQYTTPATIANEQRNIEYMREGQDRFQPLVSGRIATEATPVGALESIPAARCQRDALQSRSYFRRSGRCGFRQDYSTARNQDRGSTRWVQGGRTGADVACDGSTRRRWHLIEDAAAPSGRAGLAFGTSTSVYGRRIQSREHEADW